MVIVSVIGALGKPAVAPFDDVSLEWINELLRVTVGNQEPREEPYLAAAARASSQAVRVAGNLVLQEQAELGQSAAVGTATEADSTFALGRLNSRLLGLATSTEVALPLGRRKVRALGVAAELDTAVHIAVSGGFERHLVLRVGSPETKWRGGGVDLRWQAGRTEV